MPQYTPQIHERIQQALKWPKTVPMKETPGDYPKFSDCISSAFYILGLTEQVLGPKDPLLEQTLRKIVAEADKTSLEEAELGDLITFGSLEKRNPNDPYITHVGIMYKRFQDNITIFEQSGMFGPVGLRRLSFSESAYGQVNGIYKHESILALSGIQGAKAL